jgi:energy-coupling factor transport system substrate-specific component
MKLSVKEITVFAMLGALIFALKKAMEFAPNIHFVAVFIVAMTVVYRKKALFPIYIYVFLDGLFGGFSSWWVPYLYVWTLLWGAVMLLPKNMNLKIQPVVYMLLCGLHGLLFGVLYAPVQALMFGFTFEQTLTWIAAGLTFDIIHMVGNFAVGLLIYPVSMALKRLTKDI